LAASADGGRGGAHEPRSLRRLRRVGHADGAPHRLDPGATAAGGPAAQGAAKGRGKSSGNVKLELAFILDL